MRGHADFRGGRAQDGEGVFVAKDNQWNYVRHGTGHCRTAAGCFTADRCLSLAFSPPITASASSSE